MPVCHIYDIVEEDVVIDEGNTDSECVIRLWCLTEKSKPMMIEVNNFRPWIFVELPATRKWSDDDAYQICEVISSATNVNILSSKIEMKSKLHYYQPQSRQFPMIKIFTKSISDCKKILWWLDGGAKVKSVVKAMNPNRGRWFGERYKWMVLKAWECPDADISCARKMLTLLGIKFAEWFYFDDSHPSVKCLEQGVPYSIDIAYTTSSYQSTIKKLSDEEKPQFASSPGILAFDIESYSDNKLSFPNALNPIHSAYMISVIYQKGTTRKRVLIATEEASVSTDPEHPRYKSTSIIIDEFIIVETESKIMDAFCNLIATLNPEIITGYNIHGFDYKYLDTRYHLLNPEGGLSWPITASRSAETDPKMIVKAPNSHSKYELSYIKLDGRISLDLMPVVQKNYKLSKYNLDTVSKFFLGDDVGKHSVTPVQMFEAFEKGAATYSSVVGGILSPTSSERVSAIDKMTEVAAYAMQDSELVIDIFQKINVWIGLVELSSVAGVTISDAINRGQQCRITSLIYDIAYKEDVVIDQRNPHKKAYGDSSDPPHIIPYVGAVVQDPIPGIHDNVVCLDFSSLYPSIIMAHNICFTTFNVKSSPIEDAYFNIMRDTKVTTSLSCADVAKCQDPRYQFESNDDNSHIIEFDQEISSSGKCDDGDDGGGGGGDDDDDDCEGGGDAKKIAHFKFEFVKEDVYEGILPRLVKSLVTQRKHTRSQIPSADPLMKVVLNQRQLAYKMIANSTYGYLGAQRRGKLPLVEGAMSITARGRQMIGKVNQYVEENLGGRVIYGDTDSSMFQIPQIKSPSECTEWGLRLEDEISKLFPPPVRMEFEKAMRIFCLKKKKYAALLINKDGSYDSKMLTRGIVLERRDNCKQIRKMYEELLTKILRENYSASNSFKLICNTIYNFVDPENQATSEFEVVKSYNPPYKQVGYQMNVFGNECARIGRPCRPGDRLGFIFVTEPSSIPSPESGIKPDNVGLIMRLTEVWEELPPSDRPQINIMRYMENMFMNPIDQLFQVAYENELEENGIAKKISFQFGRTKVSCVTPMKLICKTIRHLIGGGENTPDYTTIQNVVMSLSNKLESM